MKKSDSRFLFSAVLLGFIGVGCLLALPKARQESVPASYSPQNFMRNIHYSIQAYLLMTHSAALPKNLKIVADALQKPSVKDLVGFPKISQLPYDRIRYIGANIPTNAPPTTLILLFRPTSGIGGYTLDLAGTSGYLDDDELWNKAWNKNQPTLFE